MSDFQNSQNLLSNHIGTVINVNNISFNMYNHFNVKWFQWNLNNNSIKASVLNQEQEKPKSQEMFCSYYVWQMWILNEFKMQWENARKTDHLLCKLKNPFKRQLNWSELNSLKKKGKHDSIEAKFKKFPGRKTEVAL